MRVWVLVLGLLWAGTAHAAAVMDGVRPWSGGAVPYHFEPALLQQAGAKGADCREWSRWRAGPAKQACQAMAEWTRVSGVRFVPDAKRLDSVSIVRAAATTGTMGRLPAGNRVTIEPGVTYGSVLHEFGHVLGLMHEHQRPDRDDYLRFEPFLTALLQRCTFLTEVCRDVRLAFPKVGVRAKTDYDPCSLMHYLANQAPRHPQDKRWARIFSLTDKGQARLKACQGQFAALPARCRKVGQKCAVSKLDAELVRRFNGVVG